MAGYFDGQAAPKLYIQTIKSTTPETKAIRYNGDILYNEYLKRKKDLSRKAIWERLNQSKQNFEKSLLRKEHPYKIIKWSNRGFPYDPNKAIQKPIYLLVDRRCVSSYESIIGAFKPHPHAKIVGQNSAGYVQFGNMGKIMLKYSGVQVQLATDFWKYKNGKWR